MLVALLHNNILYTHSIDLMKLVVPLRYIPRSLTARDKKRQAVMLAKSRKMYRKKKYYTRKPVASFSQKTSSHVVDARKIYNIDRVAPTPEMAKATGCTVDALQQIVRKGEGAYYSSGSRPNQTAQSWGLARLASAVTGGKSAAVDYNIIERGCNHRGRAFILANKAKKKYNHGQGKTRKVNTTT